MPPVDDGTLLSRVSGPDAGGARRALAKLYERHARLVLAFLDRHLPSPHDAEDLLHDTFLTAARRASTFRGTDARPWLLTLASNRLRDRLRSDARRTRREQEVVQRRSAGRGAQPLASSVEGALEAAMRRLKPSLRLAVELRFVQGLSHADVAQVLGVSLRSAKQKSADALLRLREFLDDEHGAHG